MSLTSAVKKQYRSIAHHLDPVVIVSENGLSDGLLGEVDRALVDHELIKVRISVSDRESKVLLIEEIRQKTGSELVQTIGKMAVLYRKSKEQNAKLSNLVRYAHYLNRK
ncbi:ribosome assembly RNA-binding protein YhbY [Oceanospirillum maris]|uniref:ribosome assembly RNA-binding protein YhbY n=1 Tax=Oceanospirillum maris TaxID=64977 RepID=UPI0004215248|nr:ribosome assembly RNA-binding protein YhbY [Oceanospirillum maris]